MNMDKRTEELLSEAMIAGGAYLVGKAVQPLVTPPQTSSAQVTPQAVNQPQPSNGTGGLLAAWLAGVTLIGGGLGGVQGAGLGFVAALVLALIYLIIRTIIREAVAMAKKPKPEAAQAEIPECFRPAGFSSKQPGETARMSDAEQQMWAGMQP
jgi:hypothetical protein